MARAESVVSDSDGKPEDVNAIQDDAMKSVELNGENAENDDGEEEVGDGEEEEYEIEAILKHHNGRFPEGRVGYFVKWKGYGSEHNSWVDEQDAGNADELIDAYWAKKKKKETTPARKPRKSIATESPEPSRKRRKSAKQADDDEEEAVSSKRKRTAKKEPESIEPEANEGDELEDDGSLEGENFMQRHMKLPNWEKLIARVDTVEKPTDTENLVVYFRLKKGNKRVRLPAKTCNEKFPQTMLSFYEHNLKWKETEMEE